MRILVGIKPGSDVQAVQEWLAALQLASAEIEVQTVAEPIALSSPAYLGVGGTLPVEVVEAQESAAQAVADTARQALNAQVATVAYGDPASEIMARAEATQADLVVAQSEPKSWFNNMFMGSVTRRLAMEGATSALLLKSAPKHGGRVAVFGSDLSEYSQRAWQQFLQMNAQGLERIIAVTAVDTRPVDFGPLLPDPTPFMPNIPVVNRDALLERLRQACPAPAGVAVEHALIDGTPADALEPYMESVGADLLVLGAQGHTWADRVAIGSVALHMTMWGRSTLLLVRPTINS